MKTYIADRLEFGCEVYVRTPCPYCKGTGQQAVNKEALHDDYDKGTEPCAYCDSGFKRYPLPIRLDLRNHSPTGFEWGYRGSGAAQLSLAILADYIGPSAPPEKCPYCESPMKGELCSAAEECGYNFAEEDKWKSAQVLYQFFKEDIISRFSKNKFELTGDQIQNWIEDKLNE
jgi:hypothetical protein